MSVGLYSRSLISHINDLKPHLQACSVRLFASYFDFCFEILPHSSIPRKLGPFHKRAARPSLILKVACEQTHRTSLQMGF